MKFRFTTKNFSGNVYYLEVGSSIFLTNSAMTPLCLSSIFGDSARLTFKLQDLYEEFDDVSNRMALGGIGPVQTAEKMRQALNEASALKWEVLRL